MKALRAAGYSTGRIAKRVGVLAATVNRYAPPVMVYWSKIIPQLGRIQKYRQQKRTWKEINKLLGYRTHVNTLITLVRNFQQRLLLMEQVEREKLTLQYEGVKWLTEQGYGADVIGAAVGSSGRKVVRQRGATPVRVERAQRGLRFPYDFERARDLYMTRGLSWWEIRARLGAEESATKLEQLFHIEADRRAGLLVDQARDLYEERVQGTKREHDPDD